MRIGLDVAQQRMPWAEVVSRAQLADDAGFDGVWGFDHFQPMYGSGPGECFEGNTTLAALSGVTRRARLGLLVTGLTYRHPSVLAAEAITIDHASGGRYELAYGAAWFEDEHRRARYPVPPDRGARRGVRRGGPDRAGPAHHRRLHLRGPLLPGARRDPATPAGADTAPADLDRRVRRPDARHRGPLRRRLALLRTAEGPRHARAERLSALAAAAGRDPASIGRAGSLSLEGDLDKVRRTVDTWNDAGYGYLVAGWPAEGRARVEEFATQVLPGLS